MSGDLFENPLGTDGFEFVEFTGNIPLLEELFEKLGFTAIAQHEEKNVTLYRQGRINFLLNKEENGQPGEFAALHNSGCNAMAFRVEDAEYALKEAVKNGATEARNKDRSFPDLPAIEGIGGSLLYFVDEYGDSGDIYEDWFDFVVKDHWPKGAGMTYIDHLTHNVHKGNMDKWAKFYEDIFNFREIRYFDIEGKLTGLRSRAMTSPCGKIRIPLNESADEKSQIKEFLDRFKGEGIQHIALGTDNIYETVEYLREHNVPLQDTPETYYEMIDERVPGHGEDLAKMKDLRILIDGAPTEDQGLLLQIFTKDAIGPVFFEIIQRKGNEGFGEGNFKALFESIELDQIRRGVLDEGEESAAE